MAKSLDDVITESGIAVEESSGGRRVAICPFHTADHTPSFTIYPNGTYFCFGCEAWGDALKFLIEHKGMDHKTALEYLGEDYKQPRAEKSQVIKIKNTQATYRYLYDVALQYHEFLLQTPGAIRYLHKRGLNDETISKYKLGYTDGKVLTTNWAWEAELATEAGLLSKGSYETLSHRITIPNITESDQCDFITGRTVTSDKVKYLGLRVPKPIHGFYGVRHSPVIFLAEGQFDWLTLSQWGYPSAVLAGNHLSRSNLLLLTGKRVVVVPDLDESNIGQTSARKVAEQIGESATILDYSELKTGSGKLDVSTLAESPGSERLFHDIVLEELPWLRFLSNRILTKWFPALVEPALSH